jgi:predicted dithiol-disulfide oxidoreductase (DUF899 family)
MSRSELIRHTVVSPERWLVEREASLGRGKEQTRRDDELARQRMALPWVRIDREYTLRRIQRRDEYQAAGVRR